MAGKREIIGVWRVKTVGAPFPYHMFTFHQDGTMLQSNPPAGNTETSDTSGMGIWEAKGQKVRARFEEFRFDFKTGEVTRGVVDFDLTVAKDVLAGDCAFTVYNVETGAPIHGPHTATVEGARVRLP